MRYLASFINELRSEGFVKELKEEIPRDYVPTHRLREAESEGKTLVFRVEGSDLPAAGNVLASRNNLYRLLQASSDEEAYRKLLPIMSAESSHSMVEEGFSENFIEYGGDVETLPAIRFYRGDGGRYVTSGIIVAEVPGKDTWNASIHRLMVVGRRAFAVRLVPRHLYTIHRANLAEGRETPVAITIGVDPLLLLLASVSPPLGVFELSLYGMITGGNLRIVKTPKYGLPVPATASVVIEGRITKEEVDEGPFVDLLSLYDRKRKQPLLKVENIFINRTDPMFHVILPGGVEHKIFMGFPREATIWEAVRRAVPSVSKVRLTPGGGGWLHAVISIDKVADGDGKTAIMAAFAAHPSLKHVVVVDSDIDPDNPQEVEWAIATRFQAGRGLVVISNARGSTLDPSSADGLTSKVGIDATAPISEREEYRKPSI